MKNFNIKYLPKITKFFVFYTILTFVIGVIMKLVLLGNLHQSQINMSSTKDSLVSLKESGKTLSAMQTKSLEGLNNGLNIVIIGIVLQWLIILITAVVYSRAFIQFKKILSMKRKVTKSEWMKFKNEYWVFLIFFFIIDLIAIYLVFKDGSKTKINGWIIYTLITTTLIPIFILGSLATIYKMKQEVADNEVYLVPTFIIKLFNKKVKNQKIKYEDLKKPPKFIRWIMWRIE